MGFEKLTEKYEVEKQQWESGFDKKAQQKMAAEASKAEGFKKELDNKDKEIDELKRRIDELEFSGKYIENLTEKG